MSFEQIISGEVSSLRIAEDDEFLAFLESAPLATGHTVVIPKQKSEYIFSMEDSVLSRMHIFAKQVALKLEAAILEFVFATFCFVYFSVSWGFEIFWKMLR